MHWQRPFPARCRAAPPCAAPAGVGFPGARFWDHSTHFEPVPALPRAVANSGPAEPETMCRKYLLDGGTAEPMWSRMVLLHRISLCLETVKRPNNTPPAIPGGPGKRTNAI